MIDSTATRTPSEVRCQFRLSTLFALTLLIGVFCGLSRLDRVYVAVALTLTCGVLLVRLFVGSSNQQHTRVVGTLLGGLLFLASLWLPVTADREILGWQAAWFYAGHTAHLDYRSVLYTRGWDVANIWAIDVGNLMALVLPPLIIWKPRRLSVVITLLTITSAAQAWSLPFVTDATKFSHGQAGYWLWCVALTVLMLARLVPFGWRFDVGEDSR